MGLLLAMGLLLDGWGLSTRFERTLKIRQASTPGCVTFATPHDPGFAERATVPLASRRALARQLWMVLGGTGAVGPAHRGTRGSTTVAERASVLARLGKAASLLVTLLGVAFGFVSPSDALQD
jgi:hypothetical protein